MQLVPETGEHLAFPSFKTPTKIDFLFIYLFFDLLYQRGYQRQYFWILYKKPQPMRQLQPETGGSFEKN